MRGRRKGVGVAKAGVLAVALMGLAACNTMKPMEVPKVSGAPLVSLRKEKSQLRPIAFEAAVVGLPRGRVIAHYPGMGISGIDGTLCNKSRSNTATLEWGTGTTHFGGWQDEVGVIFHDAMTDAGYNVYGNPNKMFGAAKSKNSAEYLIGARVVDIKGNICQEHDMWQGWPLPSFSAEFYQKVEWSVYSTLTNQTVLSVTSEGYGRTSPAQEGVMTALLSSFGSAVSGLAANADFQQLIEGGEAVKAAEATASADNHDAKPPLSISGVLPSKLALGEWRPGITESVVRVRIGGGHGSGFVISEDGYILTNAHVVGDADRVAVIFENGVEVEANVLRRHEARDVALIKVPLLKLHPLPLKTRSQVSVAEQVFVIGAPHDEKLHSSITKGIVSALRTDERTRMPVIQSDVNVTGGNSGGPMVDEKGNVVGITSYGIDVTNHLKANLNFFIPIADALEKLGVSVDPSGAERRTGKKG